MTLPELSILILFAGCAALLLFFTILIYQMGRSGHKSAPELMGRTKTFWGMLGLLFIAATTHRIVTDMVLALISALATIEYFSFARSTSHLPTLDKPLFKGITLALIPLQALLYYQGHSFAALLVAPTFLILVLPVLLVLEDQTSGVLETYGFVAAGALFFVFALGHAFGLVHIGLMPFLLCLLLTELRDLISYWLGKFFSKLEVP
jgi:predicted CDP-diglyceride synthetase/phosphatidate cytidylyltransferase